MTLEEVRNTATAGGDHRHGSDGRGTSDSGAHSHDAAWKRKENDSSLRVAMEDTCLAPKCWQAWGHALGWSVVYSVALTLGKAP